MWWGIFISTIPVWLEHGEGTGWSTIVSPLFTMLILLFLSGMPTAEGKALERWYTNGDDLRKEYELYRNQTAPIIPFCPSIYVALPDCIKWVFCFEYHRYEYPGTESQAITRHV